MRATRSKKSALSIRAIKEFRGLIVANSHCDDLHGRKDDVADGAVGSPCVETGRSEILRPHDALKSAVEVTIANSWTDLRNSR